MKTDEIPYEVVHYTTKEKALEKILSDQKIRFGLLGMTNDPRETKTWHFATSFRSSSSDPERFRMEVEARTKKHYKDFHEMSEEIIMVANQIMTEEWKVLCVTKSKKPRVTKERSYSPMPNPFKYGYSIPRLWASYGGNHTGVCLLFDGQKLNDNIQKELAKKMSDISRIGFI